MKKTLSIVFIIVGVLVGCAPDSLRTSPGAGLGDTPPPTNSPQSAIDIKILYAKLQLPTRAGLGSSVPYLAGDNGVALSKVTVFAYEGLEQHGYELWVTDGTEQGTKLLKDINPGPAASNPTYFYLHKDVAYFLADDGEHGVELWRTDGTVGGTKLVADINPGPATSSAQSFVSAGDDMFFVADNGSVGRELFKFDGTNVTLVKDIHPGNAASISSLTAVKAPNGSYALYFAANDGTSGIEPWKSLGTAETTFRIADLVAGSGSSSPSGFTILGSEVFFSAYRPEAGTELYKTNVYTTTIEGNKEFVDINAGTSYSSPYGFKAFGNKIYFRATTIAAGAELWETDGTLPGTKMVIDLSPGTASSSCYPLAESLGVLYLSCSTSSTGAELFRLNAEKTGIDLLKDIYTGTYPSNVAVIGAVNGKTILRAQDSANGFESWVSDGTPGGTMLLADHVPGVKPSIPLLVTPIPGNRAFIRTLSGAFGAKLFVTDGTVEGTKDFEFINRGVVDTGVFLGDAYFFGAKTTRVGSALWRTDGTTAGTRVVHEVKSTVPQSMLFVSAKNADDSFYFGIDDPADTSSSVWKSDGTTAGTGQASSLLMSYHYMTPHYNGGESLGVGDYYYFMTGGTDIAARKLSRTTGDRSSTVTLAGVTVVGASQLTRFGNAVYFAATSLQYGREVFKVVDGSTQVQLAADAHSGTAWSDPVGLQINKDYLFFLGKASTENSLILHTISANGTLTPIKTMTEGATLLRSKLFNFNNKVYFALSRPDGMTEVWESDGSTEGTRIFSFGDSVPNDIVAISDILQTNGHVLFIAAHKSGKASLFSLKDGYEVEAISSFDRNLQVDLNTAVAVEDKMFYTADNGKDGFELYWHNGETSGSLDLLQGAKGSYPTVLGKNNKYLLIAADAGQGMTLMSVAWDDL